MVVNFGVGAINFLHTVSVIKLYQSSKAGPAQQDFEWGGSSVSQILFLFCFFLGGGGGGSGGMLPWEN